MSNPEILTAQRFAEVRPDLPENGRWMELIGGRVVQLDPPDHLHGNVVLNLSKALAQFLQSRGDKESGYLCFELGLLVSRNPDTVYFPAISYVASGERFAAIDQTFISFPPRLVVDVASTARRRQGLAERVKAYHKFGVEEIWIADGVEKQLHVATRGREIQSLTHAHSFPAGSVMNDFHIDVASLFQAPAWWK